MTTLTAKTVSYPKVLLLGDSITQFCFSTDGCWGSLLANHLQRRCDVLSRGLSGYNSRWFKILLPSILDTKLAKETVAVTIFLGANDSNNPELNPRQHVPLEEYKQNLKEIVEFSLCQGVSRDRIILITPPAFNASAWKEECEKRGKALSKDNETTGLYARACSSLANELGTHSVDLYSEMMKNEDFPSYLCDGLHLSEKGSRLLFELLQPIIDQLSEVPIAWFPAWDQVDLNNVENSLLSSI